MHGSRGAGFSIIFYVSMEVSKTMSSGKLTSIASATLFNSVPKAMNRSICWASTSSMGWLKKLVAVAAVEIMKNFFQMRRSISAGLNAFNRAYISSLRQLGLLILICALVAEENTFLQGEFLDDAGLCQTGTDINTSLPRPLARVVYYGFVLQYPIRLARE